MGRAPSPAAFDLDFRQLHHRVRHPRTILKIDGKMPERSEGAPSPHSSCEQNQAGLSYMDLRGCTPCPAYVRAASASITAMVLRDLIGDVLRTLWSHKLRTFPDHVRNRLGNRLHRSDGGGGRRTAQRTGRAGPQPGQGYSDRFSRTHQHAGRRGPRRARCALGRLGRGGGAGRGAGLRIRHS